MLNLVFKGVQPGGVRKPELLTLAGKADSVGNTGQPSQQAPGRGSLEHVGPVILPVGQPAGCLAEVTD